MSEDDLESIPSDLHNGSNNNFRTQSIGMSAGSTGGQERFDTTTEEGLLRSILYKAKNVNPGAIERFVEAYDLGKKHFTANPQALQQLMMHTFGPGFGSDAFQLFMNTRGQYVPDTPNNGNGVMGGGINPMQIMMMQAMMQGGGGNMAQMLPLLMQGGGMGGGNGGPMGDMMSMMMMQQMSKASEKQAQQEKFDQMMNMMMLKMIGGSMDSRNQMDANSGNFMVQEILDKDKNVKERQLVPMSTVLSNPAMMMGGMFKQGGQDETTQAVLRNALEEKSKMMELYMQNNQPMMQVFASLLGNFQNKQDPIAQFGQLMEIRDKYMGGQGNQVDPEIEKMKIDLQLAMQQQNFTLKQMEHQWELEKEEKKAGSENVKSWMNMIGTVGEKLAAPAMALVAGGMGQGNKAGLLNQGPPGPAGLPPLGSGPQIVKPGDISRPPQQPPSSGSSEGIQFGTPDPDHSGSGMFPDPQPQTHQQQGEMDPQMMMFLAKQQQQQQELQAAMAEIQRLRTVIIQDQHQQQKNQPVPVLSKDQLSKMSTEKINEIRESLEANEQNTEQLRHALEAELSDREWLSASTSDDLQEYTEEERDRDARRKKSEDPVEPLDPAILEASETEQVDELPLDDPTQQEIDEAIDSQQDLQMQEPEPEPEQPAKKRGRKPKTS